jgi:hypothetical protein
LPTITPSGLIIGTIKKLKELIRSEEWRRVLMIYSIVKLEQV